MKKILLVSNGHGEDQIASVIGQLLQGVFDVSGLPLVGNGQPYKARGIEVHGPARKMPSGGFVKRNFKYFLKDIRAGFLPMTLSQVSAIRQIKSDLTLCVGDIYALLVGSVFTRKPVVFMPTAKSDYINSHYPIEIKLMKKYALKVLARDELTAKGLKNKGVDALYLGNTMMDALEFTGVDFGLSCEGKVIGLLPGSREEAYRNFSLLLDCVEKFNTVNNVDSHANPISSTSQSQHPQQSSQALQPPKAFQSLPGPMNFLLSVAPGLEIQPFIERATSRGWNHEASNMDDMGDMHLFTREDMGSIRAVQGCFGDLLRVSDIIVGMAGTGNEQAVGYGRPIVTFPGEGPQFTAEFLAVQKKLLGDAIFPTEDPGKAARAVLEILSDKDRYDKMVAVGAQRMGKPGAAKRISSFIKEIVGELSTC